MRHKISNNKLSRKSSSRKALLRVLVTDNWELQKNDSVVINWRFGKGLIPEILENNL